MAMNRSDSARAVTARLKLKGTDLYRIVCGGTGKNGGSCPRMLGWAVFRDEEATDRIEEGMPERVWYAMQRDETGFRKDESGHFHCGKPHRLRRKLSEAMNVEHFPNAGDPYGDRDDHEYDFVGNWPPLPAIIYCPTCGSMNEVPEPGSSYLTPLQYAGP